MVEAGICREVVEGTGSAGFGVEGGVDEAAYAGGVEGTGAHRAGFEGGVEGAAGEAPGTEVVGSAAEGEELGVGGRVFRRLAFVVGDRQDLLSPGDHGADGDLAEFSGSRGLFEGAAHHREVHRRVRRGFRTQPVPLRIFGLFLPAGFRFFGHGDDHNNAARYNQRAASASAPFCRTRGGRILVLWREARFRNTIPADMVEEFDQLEPETLAAERLKEVRSTDRR